VLAKNLNVPEKALEALKAVPPIFQAPVPPPLEQDRQAALGGRLASPGVFNFSMLSMKPNKSSKSGSVRISQRQGRSDRLRPRRGR
jgi:hypothetical protein